MSAHSLAELYQGLTVFPIRPRISSLDAQRLIQREVFEHFEVINLSGEDYMTLLTLAAQMGLSGGAIYDALILHAAHKARADQVLTLNRRDFQRVYPTLADKIITP